MDFGICCGGRWFWNQSPTDPKGLLCPHGHFPQLYCPQPSLMPRSHRYLPTSVNASDSNRKTVRSVCARLHLNDYAKVGQLSLPHMSWIHCTFSMSAASALVLILANPPHYGKPPSTPSCTGLVDFYPIFLPFIWVQSSTECINNKLPWISIIQLLFRLPTPLLSKLLAMHVTLPQAGMPGLLYLTHFTYLQGTLTVNHRYYPLSPDAKAGHLSFWVGCQVITNQSTI